MCAASRPHLSQLVSTFVCFLLFLPSFSLSHSLFCDSNITLSQPFSMLRKIVLPFCCTYSPFPLQHKFSFLYKRFCGDSFIWTPCESPGIFCFQIYPVTHILNENGQSMTHSSKGTYWFFILLSIQNRKFLAIVSSKSSYRGGFFRIRMDHQWINGWGVHQSRQERRQKRLYSNSKFKKKRSGTRVDPELPGTGNRSSEGLQAIQPL